MLWGEADLELGAKFPFGKKKNPQTVLFLCDIQGGIYLMSMSVRKIYQTPIIGSETWRAIQLTDSVAYIYLSNAI